jgi:hypothetical protein
MKRTWRILFFGAVALSWLAALALGLEVYSRLQTRADDRRAEVYGAERWAGANELDQAVIAKYAPAPPVVGQDIAARAAFVQLDEEARSEYARERNQLVLWCDPTGAIQTIYAPISPEALLHFAERLRSGPTWFDALSPVEAADARQAFGQVLQSGEQQPREYVLPLPDGSTEAAQFYFCPYRGAAAVVTGVGVFVRESMWEVPWQKFRKNVHQNDAYDFRTNNVGFRDDEVVLPKPPGVFRIVCVGGSTTAEGLTNDLTYPNMLEKILRQRWPGRTIEVINGGIFAQDSTVELQNFDDYLALEPDLIVHYNFVNDVTNHAPQWLRAQNPWRQPIKAIQSFARKSHFLSRHASGWLLPSDAELEGEIGGLTITHLREMGHRAEAAQVDMAICSFARPEIEILNNDPMELAYFNWRIKTMLSGPSLDISGYCRIVDRYNTLVAALCRQEGWLYIPVAENMRCGTECFRDICHMHLSAMERKARIVADALEGHLQPPGAASVPGAVSSTESREDGKT